MTTDLHEIAERPESLFPARFMAKVRITPGCWFWTAGSPRNKYGFYWDRGRNRNAHVVAFELCVRPIPVGMCVCHSCDNKKCVNPNPIYDRLLYPKLGDADWLAINIRTRSLADIAHEIGCCQSAVHQRLSMFGIDNPRALRKGDANVVAS